MSTAPTPAPLIEYEGGATYATGRIEGFTIDEGTVTTDGPGVEQSRDGTIWYRLTSSDPRVAGIVTGTWNSNRFGQPAGEAAIVQWGEATLTNESGTWEAAYAGMWTSSYGDVFTRWWRGAGDYDGHSFYMSVAEGFSDWEWTGLIFDGSPPVTVEVVPTS